ncbi:ArsR/SmtB family transcription factor [Puerhibacterium puerhi]|uniref:ArsR/SmtB family transcription factor n=1 Tax=Puerhibacterium puerhi TaxID=2692623 RepID=UPI0013580E08|nr:metalloregulator ArsR/SmtB family transcription factor [Puerhibacterium puerhi]
MAAIPIALDRATADAAACCAPGGTGLAPDAAVDVARTFKALADPARVRLLSIVAAADAGETCVCDLTEPVGLAQPTVSHHMKVLVEAGLVTREKRGKWAYYAIAPQARSLVEQATQAALTPAMAR